jgi:hypothetical protein
VTTPLFEGMMAAGGEAFAALTRAHGLTPQATEAAMRALMPAFALSAARSGPDLADFTGQPAASAYRQAYDQAARAFHPDALAKGGAAITSLFGSDALRDAVTRHVAAQSGVTEAAIKELMPLMAGALFGASVAPPPPPPPAPEPSAPANPFAPAFDAWMAALSPAPATAPAPPPPPPPPAPAAALVDAAFEGGRAMQDAQLKAMAELFERFWPKTGG